MDEIEQVADDLEPADFLSLRLRERVVLVLRQKLPHAGPVVGVELQFEECLRCRRGQIALFRSEDTRENVQFGRSERHDDS